MAKIVTSALVADVRKKIGGNVFTKVRSGAMVRRKVSPIQPRTAAQRAVRASFTDISKSWTSALSDPQRAAWIALASSYPQKDKFGAAHALTGLQMFMKINRNLQVIGAGPLLDAPPSLAAQSLATLQLDAGDPCVLTLTTVAIDGVTAVYTYTSHTGAEPKAGELVAILGNSVDGNNVTDHILSTSGGDSGTITLPLTTQDITGSGGTGTIMALLVVFTPATLDANMHLVVSGSKQVSAGRSTSFGGHATIAAFAAATTSPQDITVAYVNKYGTLISGRKVAIQAYVINDLTGAASRPLAATAVLA